MKQVFVSASIEKMQTTNPFSGSDMVKINLEFQCNEIAVSYQKNNNWELGCYHS